MTDRVYGVVRTPGMPTFRMSLGSAPWGVMPAQLGTDGYVERARRELEAYMAQLQRHYAAAHKGAQPPCRLAIAENPHDFDQNIMTYYEVDALYSDERSRRAAFWLEKHMPEDWDHEAAAVLGLEPGDGLS